MGLSTILDYGPNIVQVHLVRKGSVSLGKYEKKLFYSIYLTCHNLYFWESTLPETNIAPETSIPTIHFQGRKLLVSGRINPGISCFENL